jgi:hypothetical protein
MIDKLMIQLIRLLYSRVFGTALFNRSKYFIAIALKKQQRNNVSSEYKWTDGWIKRYQKGQSENRNYDRKNQDLMVGPISGIIYSKLKVCFHFDANNPY